LLLVLGSINIDLTTVAGEIPHAGETIIGISHNQYPGGKGANQAVCAAKLKTAVRFLGKVGNDTNGDFLLGKMSENGVDVSRIEKSETSTGMAAISVDLKGQNSIIVVPGANFSVDCAYIDRNIDSIKNCNIILAQHEVPVNATEYAFKMAKSFNKTTILNPAPAEALSETMISLTDILIPNEHELSRISGMSCRSIDEMTKAAAALLARGIKTVIVTMGKEGVLYAGKNRVYPAIPADVVDTTAAGDSFIAGFAVSYLKDRDIDKAIAYGQTVASYSIQRKGAQSSMPNFEQFEAYQKTIEAV
jgi:ribokinase